MKPKQEDPKEMVGGCCVCADENGWTENPLVYCDGQGCNVAVHQACYGIVTVPTGSWYCRKCESQEKSTRVRCELCPSKDGALKRTDSGGWAHVVCALYIPEVRFGNVTTMEPIMLQLIPPERFNKSCYICEESGKASRATIGACMQCNKAGCKQHFHVICAQAMGLLCEEAGNYLDNVKYCGYCQYHYSKLRKGSHVKTIPPYRPVTFDAISSDEESNQTGQDSREYKLKKRLAKSSPSAEPAKILSKDIKNGEGASSSKLNETQDPLALDVRNTASSPHPVKGETKPEQTHTESSNVPTPPTSTNAILKHPSLSVKTNTTTTHTSSSTSTSSYNNSSTTLHPSSISSCLASSISSSIAHSSGLSASSLDSMGPPISKSHSVPVLSSQNSNSVISVTTHSLTFTTSSTTGTSSSATMSRIKPTESSSPLLQSNQLANCEPGAEKDKLSKARRGVSRNTNNNTNYAENDPLHLNDEPSLIIAEERNLSADAKDKIESLNTHFTPNISATSNRSDTLGNMHSEYGGIEGSKRPRSQERGRRSKRGGSSLKRGRMGSSKDGSKEGRDSGASSPESFTSDSAPPAKRGRTKKTEPPPLPPPPPPPPQASINPSKLEHTLQTSPSSVPNGIGATTLLLGNQINPASSVAQKMTDTLHAELEAHSIYKEEEKVCTSLIGPPFPGKRDPSTSGSVLGNTQPPPLPQSLEQLLERQWEQGSQFLMEQAQHFDIASLLSCLHQLKQENARLEETVNALSARRDHLLAVNARLSVPLTSATKSPQPSSSSSSPAAVAAPSSSTPHHQQHPSQSQPSLTSVSGSTPVLSSSATISPSVIGGHPPHPHPSHSGASISLHSLGPGSSGSNLSSRTISQGRHPSGGAPHSSTSSSNPISGRGTSPHDRRGGGSHPQIPLPLENGLPEQEYRYRTPNSGDHPHRQHSPMLHPGLQANPGPMRQSPASSGYHSSSSPHTGVPALSPSGTGHGPPLLPSHSMSSHSGGSHHSSHSSHGGLPHASSMSSSHGPSHSSSHSRAAPPDHSRAELVRLGPAQPPHGNPSVGYPVYQMVSPPVPGSHHSPGLSQHPPSHTQVLRREIVDPGRVGGVSLEKR